MIWKLLLLPLAALAQSDDEAMPYVIVVQNMDPVYGFIIDERDWNRSVVVVELDAPWLDPADRLRRFPRASINREETRLDLPRLRRSRLAREWKAHGGVEIETESGTIWVREDEARFSEQARRLVERKEESLREELERWKSGAPGRRGRVSDVDGRGLVQTWGPHAALLSLGAALAAAVLWFMMRE